VEDFWARNSHDVFRPHRPLVTDQAAGSTAHRVSTSRIVVTSGFHGLSGIWRATENACKKSLNPPVLDPVGRVYAVETNAMLVLRRKVGERIIIADSIEITVLHVRGGRVRLGFTAPHDVRVFREEARRGSREPVAASAELEVSEQIC